MCLELVSLDSLTARPEEVLKLPPSEVREALLRCAALLAALGSIAPIDDGKADRWVDIREAALITGMSTRWLYTHYRDYDFPLGEKRGARSLRFSEVRLRKWLNSIR